MLIAMAGRKQSGKTTCCNFIYGHQLKLNRVVKEFLIGENGELVVTSVYRDDKGQPFESMGILDINQKTDQFCEYAEKMIWPIVKAYNFADTLKDICIGVLGLTYEQCYGTDEDKNSYTNYKWEDMPGFAPEDVVKYVDPNSYGLFHKTGQMTAREVMQFTGTDIFRRMNKNVWTDSVFNSIREEAPELALIGDCRYRNEAELVKENGGKVVYLKRNSDTEGDHSSENDLNDYDGFDFVIDNRNLTIKESNQLLLDKLIEWGVTQPLVSQISTENTYK